MLLGLVLGLALDPLWCPLRCFSQAVAVVPNSKAMAVKESRSRRFMGWRNASQGKARGLVDRFQICRQDEGKGLPGR